MKDIETLTEKKNEDEYKSFTIPSIENGEIKRKINALEFDEDCTLRIVVMPDSIEEIGREAFNYCLNLKELKFSSSLKRINKDAFYGCLSLESLTFPDSLESIEENAFASCDNLSSVTLGSSLSYIGEGAFSYCERLENIYVSEENENFSSIDGILYDKKGEKMVLYPSGRKDQEFTIPSFVTSIGKGCFFDNDTLEHISVRFPVKVPTRFRLI